MTNDGKLLENDVDVDDNFLSGFKKSIKKWMKMELPMVFTHILAMLIISLVMTLFSLWIIKGNLNFIIDEPFRFVGAFAFAFLILALQYTHMYFLRSKTEKQNKYLCILYLSIFVTVLISIALMTTLNVFTQTIATTAVIVGVLINKREGLVSVCVSSLLVFLYCIIGGFNNIIAAVFSITIGVLSGFLMIFVIKKIYTRFKLMWGNIFIAVLMILPAMLSAYFVFDSTRAILMAGVWAFVGNAISICVATAITPLFETLFNVWTNFKIAEQCSFNQPLLKELSKEAPGTFSHSLTVANLAESCAIAIDENPYLARAAAYYHDIGKLKQPQYFVENQTDYNPHDDLIPEVSKTMITRHSRYGYEIMKKHHMPEEIACIALEHHGTLPVMYFYQKAQNITEGKLDMEEYCYDNPTPSTKIAAIIMVADAVEAATRASVPSSPEEMSNIIDKIVKERIDRGQFNNCKITMQDLNTIKDTIVRILPSINHKRIQYPDQKR